MNFLNRIVFALYYHQVIKQDYGSFLAYFFSKTTITVIMYALMMFIGMNLLSFGLPFFPIENYPFEVTILPILIILWITTSSKKDLELRLEKSHIDDIVQSYKALRIFIIIPIVLFAVFVIHIKLFK